MSEVEISELIKKCIRLCRDSLSKIDDMEEYKAIIAAAEALDSDYPNFEVLSAEYEKKSIEFEQNLIDECFSNITEEQKVAILNAISSSFLSENLIPISSFGGGDFEYFIEYIVRTIEDKSIIDKLAVNETFVEGMGYSVYFMTRFVEKIIDEKTIREFLNIYKGQFISADLERNSERLGNDSDNFAIIVDNIVENPNVSKEFKIGLLTDDSILPYMTEYSLNKALSDETLDREDRLALLLNPEINSRMSNYYFSNALATVCVTAEDVLKFIQDSSLTDKIQISQLISGLNFSGEEFKKLLNNDIIFSKLSWLELEQIIAKAPMSFEDRKSILFDEKFFGILNGLGISKIVSSPILSSDERMELLADQRIVDALINSGFNQLPQILNDTSVPVHDKVKILKDPKFRYFIPSESVEIIVMCPDLTLEEAKDIIFDKNLFYKLIGEYHEEYNNEGYFFNPGPYRYDKYEILQKLYERNPGVVRTLSFDLLDDKLLDLGFDFIEKMSKYPAVAHRLANTLRSGEFDILKNMIKVIQNSSYSDKMDVEQFVSRLIDISLDTSAYSDDPKKVKMFSKLKSSSKIITDDLTEEEWKILTEIGLRNMSPYYKALVQSLFGSMKSNVDISLNIMPEIEKREDIVTFPERRISLCNEMFQKAIEIGDLDSAKNAYFNKYLSINLEEAQEIFRMYGTSLEDISKNPENEMQVRYLRIIKKVLECERLDTINKIYNDEKNVIITFDEMLYIDQSLKQVFSKNMSDSVFKVGDTKPTYIEIKTVENGVEVTKKIEVFEPGFDFMMLVNSTDAYGKMELINDSYYDSWNKNNNRKTNHGICCSLISNDNMGMAAVNDVLFGFDSWHPGAIKKSAPYDIYSMNDDYDIQEGKMLTFMAARDIVNHTRHTHNEQVLERYELRDESRTEELQNIQPSYVIIYSDMTDEIKMKAVKCSKEMNIPIVYLDKEKIIANEVSKIDDKITRFRASKSMDEKLTLIEEILLSHENNRSGLKATNPEWRDKYFPTDKIDAIFRELIATLKENLRVTNDFDAYRMHADRLMAILDNENQKFVVTMETIERQNTIDIPVEEYKIEIMKVINQTLGNSNVPKLASIKEELVTNHADLPLAKRFEGIDIEYIEALVARAQTEGLYTKEGKFNNVGHIERTLLLASLIGISELTENEVLDQRLYDILMTAVLYHDCAKEADMTYAKTGSKSAKRVMDFLMDSNFTLEEKQIIAIAIEHQETHKLAEKVDAILEKAGISPEKREAARKIMLCLKDANTLDVEDKNELLLDFPPIELESSKGYVSFIQQIKEKYGTIDREMFIRLCNELNMQKAEEHVMEETDGRKQ